MLTRLFLHSMICAQLEFRGRTGIAACVPCFVTTCLEEILNQLESVDQSENISSYTGTVQFYQIRR